MLWGVAFRDFVQILKESEASMQTAQCKDKEHKYYKAAAASLLHQI